MVTLERIARPERTLARGLAHWSHSDSSSRGDSNRIRPGPAGTKTMSGLVSANRVVGRWRVAAPPPQAYRAYHPE